MIKNLLDYYALIAACIISTGTIIGTSVMLIRIAISVSNKLDSLPELQGKVDSIIKEQIEQGLIVRVSATQTLLDKTKELESELDVSKERVKTINKLLHQPLYECDANGNLFFANDSFLELMGADKIDDVLGYGWMNFIEEPYKSKIEIDYTRDVKYNKSFKYRYPIESEKKRSYIDNVGNIYRNVNGDIIFILGTIRIAA